MGASYRERFVRAKTAEQAFKLARKLDEDEWMEPYEACKRFTVDYGVDVDMSYTGLLIEKTEYKQIAGTLSDARDEAEGQSKYGPAIVCKLRDGSWYVGGICKD